MKQCSVLFLPPSFFAPASFFLKFVYVTCGRETFSRIELHREGVSTLNFYAFKNILSCEKPNMPAYECFF